MQCFNILNTFYYLKFEDLFLILCSARLLTQSTPPSYRPAEPPAPGSSRKTPINQTPDSRHQKPYNRHQMPPARPPSPSCWPAEPPDPGQLQEDSTRLQTPPDTRHHTPDTTQHTFNTRHQTSLQFSGPLQLQGDSTSSTSTYNPKRQIDKGQSVGCFQNIKWLGTG